MSVKQLKHAIEAAGLTHADCLEKSDLQARLAEASTQPLTERTNQPEETTTGRGLHAANQSQTDGRSACDRPDSLAAKKAEEAAATKAADAAAKNAEEKAAAKQESTAAATRKHREAQAAAKKTQMEIKKAKMEALEKKLEVDRSCADCEETLDDELHRSPPLAAPTADCGAGWSSGCSS